MNLSLKILKCFQCFQDWTITSGWSWAWLWGGMQSCRQKSVEHCKPGGEVKVNPHKYWILLIERNFAWGTRQQSAMVTVLPTQQVPAVVFSSWGKGNKTKKLSSKFPSYLEPFYTAKIQTRNLFSEANTDVKFLYPSYQSGGGIFKMLCSDWSKFVAKWKDLLESNEAGGDEMSSPLFLCVANFSVRAVLLMIDND